MKIKFKRKKNGWYTVHVHGVDGINADDDQGYIERGPSGWWYLQLKTPRGEDTTDENGVVWQSHGVIHTTAHIFSAAKKKTEWEFKQLFKAKEA